MGRIVLALLGVAAVAIAGVLFARSGGRERAPHTVTGAVAAGDSAEIIEARRVLMRTIEQLMRPIDEFTVKKSGDVPALRSAAASIEAMMLAFPHLFPPATNLYDATVRDTPTQALPAVWDDGPTFRMVAEAAERSAAAIAASDDAESLRIAGGALRASCDACHAQFMKAYTPPTVTQEDREFDFDSVFKKN